MGQGFGVPGTADFVLRGLYLDGRVDVVGDHQHPHNRYRRVLADGAAPRRREAGPSQGLVRLR